MPAAVVLAIAGATGATAAIGGTIATAIVGSAVSATVATAVGTAVIAGGITAVQGGKASDVLKSAVLGGVTAGIGSSISASIASDVAFNAIASGTSGNIAVVMGNALGGAAAGAISSGTSALLQGKDPIEALIKGGLTAGLSAGVNSAVNEFTKDIDILSSPSNKIEGAFQRATKTAIATGILGGSATDAFTEDVVKSFASIGFNYIKEGIRDYSDQLKADADAVTDAELAINLNVAEQEKYSSAYTALAKNVNTEANSLQTRQNNFISVVKSYEKLVDTYNYPDYESTYNASVDLAQKLGLTLGTGRYSNFIYDEYGNGYQISRALPYFQQEITNRSNRLANDINSFNNYRTESETQLKSYLDSFNAEREKYDSLVKIYEAAAAKLDGSVTEFQVQEAKNAALALKGFEDTAIAKELFFNQEGRYPTDEELSKYATDGDLVGNVDRAKTTRSEAVDFWKEVFGTEPTEYDLLSIEGLAEADAKQTITSVFDDRLTTDSEELDQILQDVGRGRITLTADEQLDLIGRPEAEVRNAIAGKWNTFAEDFNTVTATEAQQRWEDAGNVRPMTPDEMFAMLAGNHDTADQIAQRTADFEQEVFNGNEYATQEDARAAAKEREVYGQYLYNGRIYSVDQEVPYKSNAATREEAVYDAIRNNKGLVEWDGKILKVPQDYDAALKTIRNSPTYIDAYNNAVRLLGPDAPFDWGDENFRTKQAFDGSSFTDKGAAALAAYQNKDTSFVFSDGKTYNIPDNFDQIAGDALLEQVSIPLKNAALADLLRPEIEAAQAERLQADAKVTVQDAWNNSFGKLGIPMPEPGTEGYESFVSFALGSTSGMIKNAIGASHWLQVFASNQNGSNLTPEQIAEYGDLAGAGTKTPEKIIDSDAYKFAKFLEQTVKQTTPEGQQQYEDFKNKTEGMSIFNKVAMGAIEAAKGNYLWITNMALSEAPEDVLTGQLLARAAYKLTGSAGLGLGINTVVDMAQATGGAYAEQLEQELAKGTPYEVAVLRAAAIAPVMGSLEAAGEFVGDRLLLKQLADSNITGLQTYLKQTGRTLLAESLGEGLSNGAQEAVGQFYNTGKFDLDGINNAIVVGSFVGPAAATISLSPNAASRVVGTMYDGTAATVQDLLNQNPNFDYSSLDRSEPIFDFGGNQLSVSQLGNVLDNNATNPNFTPAGYITNLTNLGDAGYIDVTAPEVALAVTLAPDANTLTTQLQDMGLDFGTVLNIADTKFDNAITTRDEAGSLTGTGQVIGTDPDTGEALVQLPDGSVTVVTNPGAEVGQTINVAPPVTENQVKQIVNEAIGNIQFPAGITTEDVTKAITDYMAANPGLSATDVTNAVSAELAKLPAGLSSTDVENAIDSALTDYATKTDITNAIANIQFPDGVTKAEAEKIVSDAIGKIEFPASLTEEQVGKIVADGISKIEFPQGITEKDVKDVVETATKDFATKTDIENAIKNIQFPAGITNEDVASEIKKYMEANLGLSATDVTNAVATELGKLPDYATPADVTTALDTALADYATKTYIDDAIKGIEFPQGITKEDVAAEIKAFAEANPGLSLDQVTTAITTELGKLPAYATPDDVATALDTALAGYATQANVDAATKTLQDAIDAAQAGNTTRFDDIDQAIQNLRDAGLTEDQVKSVVDASAEGLSTQFKDALDAAVAGSTEALGTLKTDLETKIGDVQTALETALGEQGAAFGEQVAALMEQGQSYQEAVDSALAALGTDIGSLGEDVATKLADLGTTLGERIGGLETQLGDVETRLAEAIQTAKDIGLEGDQALEAAINSVAADLGTTKDALLEQIGTTEEALRTDFATQLGEVTTELGNVETRLTEAIAAAEAAGLSRDEAIEAALNTVAADLGTTKEDLLGQLGTVESTLRSEIEASQAALGEQLTDVETRLKGAIADAEAAGLSRDEAIQSAVDEVASDLGTTREALLEQIGATETTLRADLEAGLGLVGEQVAGVEQRLTDAIAAAEALGLTRDQAIQAAVDAVAADLGTTREDLLTQLGTTEEALRTEFQTGQATLGEQISTGIEGLQTALADAETRINERAAEYEAAGLSRDQALQTAISDVAAQLGTTAQNLEQQLFSAQTALSEQITGVQTGLQQQIQDVATVLGKPAQAVTQADIDLVNQMIQGQVQTDLTYDANRDGVIDQNDIAFLTSITTGTEPPEFPAGTRWAPTGVYGQIAGLGADLTRQLEEQELARQAAAEEAERAAQGRFQQQQQQQRVQQFMGMLTQPGALQQKVQVKAPEVMKLEQLYGGLYDPTAGLFRTPQQQQFFASPYGNYFDGGEVTEDELLAIVRG